MLSQWRVTFLWTEFVKQKAFIWISLLVLASLLSADSCLEIPTWMSLTVSQKYLLLFKNSDIFLSWSFYAWDGSAILLHIISKVSSGFQLHVKGRQSHSSLDLFILQVSCLFNHLKYKRVPTCIKNKVIKIFT